jgi:hypothetical protein
MYNREEIQLQKLKKNVFLQPEKGFVAHPVPIAIGIYREDRARIIDNCLFEILVP